MTRKTRHISLFAVFATVVALFAGALSISGSQKPRKVTILCTTDTLGSVIPCG